MRFVIDENTSPRVARTLCEFGVEAVHTSRLFGQGVSDVHIAERLLQTDVFVSRDSRLLGRNIEVAAFHDHGCRIVSIRSANLTVREQVGLLLLWSSEIEALMADQDGPCVVNLSKAGPKEARRIRRPPMAYGSAFIDEDE